MFYDLPTISLAALLLATFSLSHGLLARGQSSPVGMGVYILVAALAATVGALRVAPLPAAAAPKVLLLGAVLDAPQLRGCGRWLSRGKLLGGGSHVG